MTGQRRIRVPVNEPRRTRADACAEPMPAVIPPSSVLEAMRDLDGLLQQMDAALGDERST